MHYAIVYFRLIIMDGREADGYNGNHNVLRIVEHSSAALYHGQVPGQGHGQYIGTKVVHQLPMNADMQFWRHWHWNPFIGGNCCHLAAGVADTSDDKALQ
jgi:hypothetical protein